MRKQSHSLNMIAHFFMGLECIIWLGPSSVSRLCVYEQCRLCWDCAFAQAGLSLLISTTITRTGSCTNEFLIDI